MWLQNRHYSSIINNWCNGNYETFEKNKKFKNTKNKNVLIHTKSLFYILNYWQYRFDINF